MYSPELRRAGTAQHTGVHQRPTLRAPGKSRKKHPGSLPGPLARTSAQCALHVALPVLIAARAVTP
ncbi:hypothetical protein EDF60_0455 [Leucobacter luti]|uniref:Uncharacterized protein n=1 Tax=Leucobacter luti TaxID=340320 RepID=A0A4R6S771_9MICO|nr:hypothetical protein [Leucobacter luti]TCK45229.1 hypothetical protein EDF60_0455 [Leucobacter luti]TDP95759.1 hypothetical protein EDF62_0453 [Leucobacter luti]